MSPIALKQYLTLAGRNSQSRADNIEDSAQSYRRRPLTAPLPECLAVADSQQYAQMEPISSFKSATRPWDADGPMRVLSDADLVVTRRCKVTFIFMKIYFWRILFSITHIRQLLFRSDAGKSIF